MMQRTSTPFVTTTTTLLGVFLYLMAQKLESSAAFVVPVVSTRSPPPVAALHYRRGGSDDEWYSPPATPTSVLQPRVVETTTTTSPPAKALQTSITSVDELHAILNDPTDTRLVIVKFYASWCKTCAMLGMKMDKLAAEYADWVKVDDVDDDMTTTKLGHVRIVNVEYGTARDVCRHYAIERLPTIHMYMPSSSNHDGGMERVQDFSCNSKQFQRVKDLTIGYIQQQQYRATTKQQHAMEEDAVDIDIDPALNAKLDAGRAMIQSAMTSTSD